MKNILATGWFGLGLLACIGVGGCEHHQALAGKKGPPEVFVSVPVYKEITDYEEFSGRLESDQTIQLRARVTGYLLKQNFKEGGIIKKGDVLFEIDPQLYEADLALAEGNLAEAQGQNDQAKADWIRAQQLPAGAISPEERNKYKGNYVVSEGKLKAAKAMLKKAQVNMAYTKVHAPLSGKVSKAAIDPGNLVKADDTILTSIGSVDPIKAYFDVDERTVNRILILMKKGDINGDPTGTPVEMGLADDEGRPHKGSVDFFDSYVDPSTGTLRVRGTFANPDRILPSGKHIPGLLVPGMFVRVRLPIGKAQKALLVAEKALVTDQGQKFVYVVTDENSTEHEGKVEYRRVEIGRLHDGLRVIRPFKENVNAQGKVISHEGLKPNEKVVVSGLQRVRPDIKVKFKDVEMPANEPGVASAPSPSQTGTATPAPPKSTENGRLNPAGAKQTGRSPKK